MRWLASIGLALSRSVRRWLRRIRGSRRDLEKLRQELADVPRALVSEFTMSTVNESLELGSGPITLRHDDELLGKLDGALSLRWLPEPGIEFSGTFSGDWRPSLDGRPLTVEVDSLAFSGPALLNNLQSATGSTSLRGSLASGVSRPAVCSGPITFYLVRFPNFLGVPIVRSTATSIACESGRLAMTAGGLTCVVDTIAGIKELTKQAEREPGYVISHVGQLSSHEPLSTAEADRILTVLHWLFAFMRGARTGPILPSVGVSWAEGWIELAPWRLDDPRRVSTWLPTHSRPQLDELFMAFLRYWSDAVWNDAIRTGLAWYIAANNSTVAKEVRVPLTQTALELLAWVRLVERGAAFTERTFNDFPAHQRIRELLSSLSIPVDVPPRLVELCALATDERVDGVECITRLRNRLVHPTSKNRQRLEDVDGLLYWQAGQLGLEWFELAVLALCGYQGKYARRAFNGWKGDDEVDVPWIRRSDED